MQLVVRTPHGDAEIAIEASDTDVTIGDVVRTVTDRSPGVVVRVDGRPMPVDTRLDSSGAVVGSVIEVGDVDAGPTAGVVELVQTAGPGSGHRASLAPGTFVLGPSVEVDASELSTAAVRFPRIRLVVDDDGTACVRPEPGDRVRAWVDGTALESAEVAWSGGPLVVGARVYELRRPTPAAVRRRFAAVDLAGKVAFNRPARTADLPDTTLLEVPDGGGSVRDARRFPLLAMLAPLPIAVGMALLLGSPRFLVFGLMSPMMAGASWLSERRQRRREVGDAAVADTEAVAEFRRRATQRHRTERARRLDADADAIDIVDRATSASPMLWQRRPGDHDVFHVTVGLGTVDWTPPLERTASSLATADAILAEIGPLRPAPVVVDLGEERGVGIVGDEEFSRSAARGLLLHACVNHGPADIDVVVLTTPVRIAEWDWAKWLPHARTRGRPMVLADAEEIGAWAKSVADGWERPNRPAPPGHLTLVVVDEVSWWRDRRAPLRPLFADPTLPVRFIASADRADDLPAVCTTVVAAEPGGTASVEHLLQGVVLTDVAPFLFDPSVATGIARRLSPLDDPDLAMAADTSLPTVVPIATLLDLPRIDADSIVERWSPGRRPPPARFAAGVTAQGRLDLDLDVDGPHGLIAGTTGSGKSELLRSLVISLAVQLQPDEINFVLVDFKGGSAFDACAVLPHTVGMVTDLDEHLAGRVLRCLRAELHHRELVLRDAGASDLLDYQDLDGVAPLPRLVLVVDEFASVAAELPEFLPSLVDIAQRGRSLGIHMILATQRPAGVVDNKIKANTDLRIALRVQDDGDSMDVIGSREASALPRRIPGRAMARFSAGELTLFQSAYSTGTTAVDDEPDVDIGPWTVGRPLTPVERRMVQRQRDELDRRASLAPPDDDDNETDLSRLVAAVAAASTTLGQNEQRRPAPEPLPDHIPLVDLFSADPDGSIPIGMVDLPDEQRQTPLRWTPGTNGSRLIYGISGSGTSSLLVSMALGIATRHAADDVHIVAIDADTNTLAPLARLPHCGAVIRLDETERITRLSLALAAEVDRRKELAAELGGPGVVADLEPSIVVMIDNVGTLRQTLDDDRELDGIWQTFERIIRDGQALGVCAVLTAKQERAVPSALASQIPDRLVMRLGDQFAYAGFGFRAGELPTFVPGRAVRPDDKVEIQLVEPPPSLADHIDGLDLDSATLRPPLRVDPLPAFVLARDVAPASSLASNELRVAVGLDRRTAAPAMAVMPFGESTFVTGPARSGRSAMLATIALGTKQADAAVTVFGVTPRGGPLAGCDAVDDAPSTPGDVADWVERIASTAGRRIVLVDDADRVGGPSFERLASIDDAQLVIVMSGRADGLRAMSHWTRPLQKFRHGVLIRPTMTDGELIKVALGTRLPRFAEHHGFVVNDGDTRPLLAAVVEPPEPRGGR